MLSVWNVGIQFKKKIFVNDPTLMAAGKQLKSSRKKYLATVSKEKKQQECTQMEKTKNHYPTQVRPTGGRREENYRNFSFLHQPTHFDAKPPTGLDH